MIRAAFLALLLLLGGAGLVQAQVIPLATTSDAPASAQVPPPAPGDLRELNRLLADPSVQAWLREAAEASAREAPAATPSPRIAFEAAVERIAARARQLGAAARALPQLPGVLAEEWRAGFSPAERVRGVTLVVIFVMIGAGLEWLYRQAIRLRLLRLTQAPQSAPARRVLTALERAGLMVAGLAIFAAGSIGAFVAFDWPEVVRVMVLDALAMLLAFRAILALSLFVLAPFAPSLRLVPFSTAMARAVHRLVAFVAAATLATFAAYFFFERLVMLGRGGAGLAEMLPSVRLAAGLALLFVFWGALLYAGRRLPALAEGADPAAPGRWRFRLVYLAAIAFLVLLAWALGAYGAMWALAIFGPLPLVLAGVRAWIDHFFDQSTAALEGEHRLAFEADLEEFRRRVAQIGDEEERAAQVEPEMSEMPDPYAVARPVVQRLVRFVLVVGAIFAFAAAWGVDLGRLGETGGFLGRAVQVLLDSVVVLLIADLVWTWARTVIDRRLEAYVPPEGSEAPGPEARMITLLPLFRTTILVFLLALVGLTILNSLGVNIAPLLAGAGVIGIAIGFGTQSLVRDIVSGLFFLIDDAFRVGEYIEVGDLMGTVESISLRSMRIRHHRGKVHTVPYGELKSVTNHSRDWVIMKLEFRVPFDTDLQRVKKIVKKVGEELKQNEYYGKSILQTLKSQGVRRMEEFNMVVGVKFMTKPGEQWLVRRDAYQKLRDAFEEAGIRLAERNVRVEIDRDPASLSDGERNAIAAAAQAATEPPPGPPKPVPDEP